MFIIDPGYGLIVKVSAGQYPYIWVKIYNQDLYRPGHVHRRGEALVENPGDPSMAPSEKEPIWGLSTARTSQRSLNNQLARLYRANLGTCSFDPSTRVPLGIDPLIQKKK